jgi:hypothetical protein
LLNIKGNDKPVIMVFNWRLYFDYWRGRSNDRKNTDTLRLKSEIWMSRVGGRKRFVYFGNKQREFEEFRERVWSGKTHSRHRFPYNKFL